jgi:hypothetical protein
MQRRPFMAIVTAAVVFGSQALVAATAGAQEPSVSGKIEAAPGDPLAKQPITIEPLDPTAQFDGKVVTFSNEDGDFSFFNLPPGRYRVTPMDSPQNSREITIEEQSPLPFLWSDPGQATLPMMTLGP